MTPRTMTDSQPEPLVLGVDTGGTYTDAVLVSPSSGPVIWAKALTTPDDLSRGIMGAIDGLDAGLRGRVERVCLSTTLATNAVVEGRGARVFLFLLGHDEDLIERFALAEGLPGVDYAVVRGRMSQQGEEQEALDAARLAQIARQKLPTTDAFAVSGYFAIKNPAHEQAARELIASVSDRPVVCGHELSAQLDCIRRAATCVLNARLLPLVRDFVSGVARALAERDLGDVPLYIMRGDGSLMTIEAAHQRPVETTLSGPAASISGACYLAGASDAVAVDMGGTTTDLAVVTGGAPRLAESGATVGSIRTHVRACSIRTLGLGGDSHITLDLAGRLCIGPRRVIPLCLADREAGGRVADRLSSLALPTARGVGRAFTDFLMLGVARDALGPTVREEALLRELLHGPRDAHGLCESLGLLSPSLLPTDRLEALGAVQRAGLTPTDLLHATGRLALYPPAAAALAARALADRMGLPLGALCDRVLDAVATKAAVFILDHTLGDALPASCSSADREHLLQATLAGSPRTGDGAVLEGRLDRPLIAIGAPADPYLVAAGHKLRAEVIVPPCAEVANAVGTAIGVVQRTVEIDVRPIYEGPALSHYAVFAPTEKSEWPELEDALAYAEDLGARLATEELHRAVAGGNGVCVDSSRLSRIAETNAEGAEVLMGVLVRTTAWIEDDLGAGSRRGACRR